MTTTVTVKASHVLERLALRGAGSGRRAVALAFCGLASAGCASGGVSASDEGTPIGAILPFTGREAALGRNIEQSLLLAVEDVNRALGGERAAYRLVSRDSYSGDERGLDAAEDLLYEDEVAFLVGPEEDNLGNDLVAHVKALDVFNMLPGYGAAKTERVSTSGAWMRLAPSTFMVSCGMAVSAVLSEVESMNTLASSEDYNLSLASDLTNRFGQLGGHRLPNVSVESDASSYDGAVDRALERDPDRTVLIAYPATAAAIVTEAAVTGRRARWYLPPLLRTEAFLYNVPFGALDGSFGLSPSLSLPGECEEPESDADAVECTRENAKRFKAYFAERWDGDKPLAASHLYYDSAVLIAMGVAYGRAVDGERPDAKRLHALIRELHDEENPSFGWEDLDEGFAELREGNPMRYIGAGAEYSFDRYGSAQHFVFDTWGVDGATFEQGGSVYAKCRAFF